MTRSPPRLLNVELGARSYPIRIGSGLVADRNAYREALGRPALLVTDDNVAAHWLAPVQAALSLPDDAILRLPPGEPTKTLRSVEQVLDWMLAQALPRDGILVALGGGVIGDLAGFAAAIYQRGIDFVQIPTTLLAQVDSSVGGKTGVNHPRGKNMIGAFHQPRVVVADIDTLATLPRRELLAGIAEVIKYGLLGDAAFFGWLESNMDSLLAQDPASLIEVVERCCAMKAQIVAADERESGRRALLNLGHTFGHAVEAHTGYGEWLHGEAVAIGMCVAARLSLALGWIDEAEAQRAIGLIRRAGLPVDVPAGMTPDDFMRHMAHDKKVQSGRLRFVLLRELGDAVLTADVDDAQLRATLADCCDTVVA